MKKHTDPNARLGGELMSAKVVERLAAELKTGRYAGQDRLPAEVELAAQLGVSRTVVRDALNGKALWSGCGASAPSSTGTWWSWKTAPTTSWSFTA